MEILSEIRGAPEDKLPLVEQRVREAAVWAEQLAVDAMSAGAFRTLASPDAVHWLWPPAYTVRFFVEQRASRVGPQPGLPRAGRLLAFLPEETLSDGAAEQESDGFFDVDNVPPWDLWVALLRFEDEIQTPLTTWPRGTLVLVSWIPKALQPLCDWAIEVNPEACITWLDQLVPAAAEAILPVIS